MYKTVVIYGGRSPEHDVSILTGLHLAKHITDDYAVTMVYMTRDNKFVLGSRNVDRYISGSAARAPECRFSGGALYRCGAFGRKITDVDCVINCCHGGDGESGGLAALMKIADIPMTGCDMLSAYRQQDKIETRKILTAAEFAQPKFTAVTKADYDYLNDKIASTVKLPLPVIVKPNMLGSSIGITVANTEEELTDALHLAFTMADTAIVEELLTEMREVNIAVMRMNGEIITSAAEAVGGEKFFSFDEKYMSANGGFIKKSAKTDEELKDEEFLKSVTPVVSKLAKDAYKIFNSSGVVRTDCIVTKDKVILNENNTVPGFMAYHLWLKSDIPYGVVIDAMVREAVTRHKNSRLITNFQSEILTKNRQLVVEF